MSDTKVIEGVDNWLKMYVEMSQAHNILARTELYKLIGDEINRAVEAEREKVRRLREALDNLAIEACQVCDEGCRCELCQEVTKARALLAETGD